MRPFIRKFSLQNMSKRLFSDRDSNMIDVDAALRPGKQQRRVEGASGTIATDVENVMDNWFISSKEEKAQRTSSNVAEKRAWEARRALDPEPEKCQCGSWFYSRGTNEIKYVAKQKSLSGKTEELSLRHHAFPAEGADRQISWIYHDFWLCGNRDRFLKALDDHYTKKQDCIPEETVWKIFTTLIWELVPSKEARPNDPPHIVEHPNTIWQVGKCMFQIITHGRFWDDENNVLNPVDNGQKFGEYKKKVLQQKYSKNLLKHILACLAVRENARPTRAELLAHFRDIAAVYAGTYKRPKIDDEPGKECQRTHELIPKYLTNQEFEAYETLIRVVKERKEADKYLELTPLVFTITDLAKDYDDLLAMICLKELHRLGVIRLSGFVANLTPADKRALFGRGALDSLKLKNIPIGEGTIGDPNRDLFNYPHEFDNTDDFMAHDAKIPTGDELLEKTFKERKKKLTILTISSLRDIAQFEQKHPDLVKQGTSNFVMQGGYRMVDDHLIADEAAQNNKFDMESAQYFHTFIQKNKIPSTVWTKVAAAAVPLYNNLFEYLADSGHVLGPYLRKTQVEQDLKFYQRSCSSEPFAPHMTQDWYVTTKSTWFAAGHEPDEEYPMGEAMVPYFTKIIAYDALAAVGCSGNDVLEALGINKPLVKRTDAEDKLHTIVGVPEIRASDKSDGLPAEENFDAVKMGVVITALIKGSILAVQQNFDSENEDSLKAFGG